MNENVIFNKNDFEIVPMVSIKGNLYICVIYKGMNMGFCNIGDKKTQDLFLHLCFPNIVEKANNIRKDKNLK